MRSALLRIIVLLAAVTAAAAPLHFQQFARKPIPPQYERPARPLEFYTAHTSDQIPDF